MLCILNNLLANITLLNYMSSTLAGIARSSLNGLVCLAIKTCTNETLWFTYTAIKNDC